MKQEGENIEALCEYFRKLRPEAIKRMANSVVKSRQQIEKALRQCLEDEVRHRIRIDKFRNPWKASNPKLAFALSQAVLNDSILGAAVLNAWHAAESDLREAMAGHLRENCLLPREPQGFPVYLNQGMEKEIDDALSSFSETHPRFSREDAQLMMFCLMRWPLPNTWGSGESIDSLLPELSDTPWGKLLKTLTELPADSPHWRHAGLVAVALLRMSHAKLSEQERSNQKKRLLRRIDSLYEEFVGEFAYLGLPDRKEWSMPPLDEASEQDTMSALDELAGHLDKTRSLREKKISTLMEDQKRQDDLRRIGKQASTLCERIRSLANESDARPDESDDGFPDPGKPVENRAARIEEEFDQTASGLEAFALKGGLSKQKSPLADKTSAYVIEARLSGISEEAAADASEKGCSVVAEGTTAGAREQGGSGVVEEAAADAPEQGGSGVVEEAAADVPEQGGSGVVEEAAADASEQGGSGVVEEAAADVPEQGGSGVVEEAAADASEQGGSVVAEEAAADAPEQGCSVVAEGTTAGAREQGGSGVAEEIAAQDSKSDLMVADPVIGDSSADSSAGEIKQGGLGEAVSDPIDSQPAIETEQGAEPQPELEESLQKKTDVLSRLEDGQMRQIFREALENPEATAPLEKMLCENQLRWLRKGQNFRAWVAALHYEAEPSMYVHANPDDRSGPVPSWLCWIALVMGEPQGIQLEIDMPALIPHLVHAHTLEPKLQRFLLLWLSVGVLGPEPGRAMPLAEGLSSQFFLDRRIEESDFLNFCTTRLVGSAARGQFLRTDSMKTSQQLIADRDRETEMAFQVVHLAANYRNTFVSKFWRRLTSRRGPVLALIEGARRGHFPERIPEAESLACTVEGWDQVMAAYRNNILKRLEKALEHLRVAAAFESERLRRERSAPATVLTTDVLENAIREGRDLEEQLRLGSCPSISACGRVVNQLETLARSVQKEMP